MKPVFEITFDGEALDSTPLDADASTRERIPIGESEHYGFQLSGPEPNSEYRVIIGDDEESALAATRLADRFVWPASQWFESARGLVSVCISSRKRNSLEKWEDRGALLVNALPEKLGESRYQVMFDHLRRLSLGLVFDLVSKTHRSVASVGLSSVSARPPHLELLVLENLWERLSAILLKMSTSPVSALNSLTEVRPVWGSERLAPNTIMRLASAGINPRSIKSSRPLNVVNTRLVETYDTFEHQVIVGFLLHLQHQVRDCFRSATEHIELIQSEKSYRDIRFRANQATLYESFDMPRLRRLQDACIRAKTLLCRIGAARQLSFLRGVMPRIAEPRSPVFDNVTAYHYFRRILINYLNSSLVVLSVAGEERMKATSRMFEQWVFFQIAASFRAAGFLPQKQSNLFAASGRRFVVDLDRGASIQFDGRDGRQIRLRYEPYIFPVLAASQLGDSVYRGRSGDTPWSPDLLIEFLVPGDKGMELDYAVVIDAKYRPRIQQAQWKVDKYTEIRSVKTNRQVVRQVWIAYPSESQVVCRDSSIEWTPFGPSCSKDDIVLGTVGLLPPESAEADGESDMPPNETALQFVKGITAYFGTSPLEHVSI